MKRIILPFKMFWLALIKPQIFQKDIFAIVARMFETLAESTKQKMPLTTKLCMVDMTEGKDVTTLLSIWVGVGEESNPVSRCAELADKIRKLESEKPTVSEAEIINNITLTSTYVNTQPNSKIGSPINDIGQIRVETKNLIEYLEKQGVIVK